jgi:hypothetical protein
MPLDQVQPGMDCTGETVVQGTTISSFNVHVVSVVQSSSGTRILVTVAGPAVDATGVAEGMSGSPVYCPDSNGTMVNAGAISEGIGEYGNKSALVTPIEQMTSDTPAAVIGEVGGVPPLVLVRVTARELDTGRVVSEQTQVADETDVGLPLGTSALDTVAPVAIGRARSTSTTGRPRRSRAGCACA